MEILKAKPRGPRSLWRVFRTNRTADGSDEKLDLTKDTALSPFFQKNSGALPGRDTTSYMGRGKKNMKAMETETNSNVVVSGDVCLMSENPNRAIKFASKGRIQDIEKLLHTNPERLKIRDAKGRTPLHYATAAGHVVVVDFLLQYAKDYVNIDDVDNAGNTSLHVAVESDQKMALDYLITHGANTELADDKNRAPVHLAVELNKHSLLETMLNYDSVDANLADKDGGTPLHYAAWKDYPECSLKLLEKGAKMCKKCNIGLTPLHVAAQNASSKSLQIMLDHAEKAGYKREDVLNHVNQEKFTPLHAAIASGEISAVKVCLEAGGRIDSMQEDGSNAVHLAAAQGATEMIELMFKLQPDKKASCLQSKNCCGMTPLHKAVLFDRDEAAHYLIQQGSDLESICEGGYTPVLLAASKRSWTSIHNLLQQGATCNAKDDCDRNILHIIIKQGGRPSDFKFNSACCKMTLKYMLDQKDSFGCTPLHYASKAGNLNTLDDLIKMGAVLNIKNNNKQSPLHFAARYGRYNTCRRLMETSGLDKVIINETDEKGMTPIHVAALNGHVKVVQLLLQKGAGLHRDVDGNTPLHLAARNGYTTTMTTLINVHPQLVDMSNKVQDTPLHLCAKEDQANAATLLLTLGATISRNQENAHFLDVATMSLSRDVCIAAVSHERWREILDSCSYMFSCPMLGLIKHMPDVCEMVLDKCRIPSSCHPKDKTFHYKYDFHYLQLSLEQVKLRKEHGEPYQPMVSLNTMVRYNRVCCLSHPVCLQFLKMKWLAYGMAFHLVNLAIYLLFLASLTVFIASYSKIMDSVIPVEQFNTTEMTTEAPYKAKVKLDKGQNFLVYFILSFCALNVVKELVQMVQQKWKYFADANNYIEWILYISTGVFIGPFTMSMTSPFQWECGAVSVFLAWFNLLLFLQRFDFFGIYVVMFLEILSTLLHVIIVFSVLIIAFGLSFYVLLSDGSDSFSYHNPAISLLTTIVMMLGSIDYIDNWVQPIFEGKATYVALRAIMLILFVLLMPILLINLLIGLAVGDIEAVQRDARLKRLAMQVELHTDIEKKLPQKILERVDKTTWSVYPNYRCSKFNQFWNYLTRSTTNYGEGKGHLEDSTELENQTYLYQELYKQKSRVKKISANLDKQYDLLKLIVQKMEIRTEADEYDEGGVSAEQQLATTKQMGWQSQSLRQNLLKQATVVQKWKSLSADK